MHRLRRGTRWIPRAAQFFHASPYVDLKALPSSTFVSAVPWTITWPVESVTDFQSPYAPIRYSTAGSKRWRPGMLVRAVARRRSR